MSCTNGAEPLAEYLSVRVDPCHQEDGVCRQQNAEKTTSPVGLNEAHRESGFQATGGPFFSNVSSVSRSLPIHRQSWLRRRIEQVAAAMLLVMASPVLFLLAIAVRLTSPGKVFYHQTRSGIGGRDFEILKFRSMVDNAEGSTGAVWASKDDPRVTMIGYWLRKLHLDELPQLVNIVRGDMAFVGPRPERPEIIRQLEREIPGYRYRLNGLPGVTGLAQVNLDPDESIHSVKRKFELDMEYLFNAAPLLDLRIILTTLVKMTGIPKEIATAVFMVRRIPLVPGVITSPERETDWENELDPTLEVKDEMILETVG